MKAANGSYRPLIVLFYLLVTCCNSNINPLPAGVTHYTPVNLLVFLSVQRSDTWGYEQIDTVISAYRFNKNTNSGSKKELFIAAALAGAPEGAESIKSQNSIRFNASPFITNGDITSLAKESLHINETATTAGVPKSLGMIMPHLFLKWLFTTNRDVFVANGYCIDTINIITISPSDNLYEKNREANLRLIKENEALHRQLLGDWYAIVGTNNEPLVLRKYVNSHEDGGFLKVSQMASKPGDESIDGDDWNSFFNNNMVVKKGGAYDTVTLTDVNGPNFSIMGLQYAGQDAGVTVRREDNDFVFNIPAEKTGPDLPVSVDLVTKSNLIGNYLLHKIFSTRVKKPGWFKHFEYRQGWLMLAYLAAGIVIVVLVYRGIYFLHSLAAEYARKKEKRAALLFWLRNQGLESTGENAVIAMFGAEHYKLLPVGKAPVLHIHLQKQPAATGDEYYFTACNNGELIYSNGPGAFYSPVISLLCTKIFEYNLFNRPSQLQTGNSLAELFRNHADKAVIVNLNHLENPYFVTKTQTKKEHFTVHFHLTQLQLLAPFSSVNLPWYYQRKKSIAGLSAALNCNLWRLQLSGGQKTVHGLVVCLLPGGETFCIAKLKAGLQTTVTLFDEFDTPRADTWQNWREYMLQLAKASPGAFKWLCLPENEPVPGFAGGLADETGPYTRVSYNLTKKENYITWLLEPYPFLLLLQKEGKRNAKILSAPFATNKKHLKLRLFGKRRYFLMQGLHKKAPYPACTKELFSWHYNTTGRLSVKRAVLGWDADNRCFETEDHNNIHLK